MLSIRQRGTRKIWYIRGTVRVGEQQIEVAERSTGCSDRAAAAAFKTRLEKQLQDELIFGKQKKVAEATFSEIGLLYISRPGGLNALDTWRVGQLDVELGQAKISEILQAWPQFIARRCANLQPATVERFRSVLQAALNFYGELHGVDVPKIPKRRFKNQRLRFLHREQRDKLIVAYPKHVQPIILTLAFQGCRTQEALQLTWDYVDLERGTMHFARTKNGEPRTVKMHVRVHAAINDLWVKHGKPVSGPVFLNRVGKQYADTRDYKLPGGNPLKASHASACRKAGIADFTVHDWRHSWASACVMAGIDLPTIQRLGGWKSLRMVERYAAVATHHMEEALAKLI